MRLGRCWMQDTLSVGPALSGSAVKYKVDKGTSSLLAVGGVKGTIEPLGRCWELWKLPSTSHVIPSAHSVLGAGPCPWTCHGQWWPPPAGTHGLSSRLTQAVWRLCHEKVPFSHRFKGFPQKYLKGKTDKGCFQRKLGNTIRKDLHWLETALGKVASALGLSCEYFPRD